jgi:hypothetical protein
MVDPGDAAAPPGPYVRAMPTTTTATAEQLAAGFNRCFETFDPDEGIFAEDAFFDLYPPLWRFQLQGRDVIGNQLRATSEGTPPSVRTLRVVPTATGFVTEHEEVHATEIARRLILCEVRGGLITEVLVYCNGGWDAELRARQAAEAPMLRPWETAR